MSYKNRISLSPTADILALSNQLNVAAETDVEVNDKCIWKLIFQGAATWFLVICYVDDIYISQHTDILVHMYACVGRRQASEQRDKKSFFTCKCYT